MINLIRVITLFWIWYDPTTSLSDFLLPFVIHTHVRSLPEVYLLFARIGLDAVIAIIFLFSGLLMVFKRREGS